MDLNEFIDYTESLKLYRQSRVVRWQMRDYMFSENDAEHQLYTTQLIVLINSLFNVPAEIALKALNYGCCHDYVESTENSLGDINYQLKEEQPELKEIVKAQERKAMQTVPAFYATMCACEEDKTARAIVDLADSLEALLYDRRELRFNAVKDDWLQIEQEILVRVTMLWSELENKFKNN